MIPSHSYIPHWIGLRSFIAVHIVSFGIVWIVADVATPIDADDVIAGVLPRFHFCDRLRSRLCVVRTFGTDAGVI